MSDATALRVLEASDLTWPVTYRFNCQGGGRLMSWEMSVDAFALNGLHDETVALGPALFTASIATAISSSISLLYYDFLIHKESPAPSIGGGAFAGGRQFALPAPRAKTGVIALETGIDDERGYRRHYLNGMPNNWQDENGLTSRGWDGAMAYAHLLCMGMSGSLLGGQLQLLLAYWNILPRTIDNFFGVGFRRVTSYSVFQYTEKAPGTGEAIWPPTGS